MATREEKIAFLQSQAPSSDAPAKTREEKIAFLQSQAAKPQVVEPEQSLGERIGRGALKTLPFIGALGGATIGSAADVVSGPVGTVVGGSLGATGGKSLQNFLESAFFGDNKTREEINSGLIDSGKTAAMAEMGGQSLAAVPGLVKSGLDIGKAKLAAKIGKSAEYTPIANKDAVVNAAKSLGIDNVPRAVLSNNPTFQKLESGLSQSGSLPAGGIRSQYNDFFKGVDSASQKIAELKTPVSEFGIGKQIQGDLADQVNASRQPVSEMYNDLTPRLKKIPVNEAVTNSAFGALKRNPLFQTKDGIDLLNEYKTAVQQQPELASLKEFRSTLRDSVGAGASPVDAKRMEAIAKTVTSIRDNTINALKGEHPEGFHPQFDKLIDDISLADAAHSSNIKDINSVKSIVGNKDFKSPTTFLNKLGDLKEADVAQKASNLDVATFRNLQEKFPSVFEKAKTAKVNDMIQNATNPASGFSDVRFMKQYNSMDQEMKDLIFKPEMQTHIDSLSTLKQAIPDKLGPSGTPEGQMMMDMFNPKRTALDYGIKKTLDSAANKSADALTAAAKATAPNSANPSPVLQLLQGSGEKSAPAAAAQRAADQPLKGKDKWADDGLKKLLEHTDDADTKSKLEKLKGASADDPKLKDLLIQASDLKPGSKAMEAILSKIKAKSKIASGE